MGRLDLPKTNELEDNIAKRLQLTLDNLNFDHDSALNAIFNTFTLNDVDDRVALRNLITDLKDLINKNAYNQTSETKNLIKSNIEKICEIISKYLGFLDEFGNENPKGNSIESIQGYLRKINGEKSGFVLDCKLSTLFLYWILKENNIECNLIVRFLAVNFDTYSNKLAHPSVYISIKGDGHNGNTNLRGIKVDFTSGKPFFNTQNYLKTNEIEPFFISSNSTQEAFIILDILYTIGSSLVDASKEINSKLDQENILEAIVYFFSQNSNPEIANTFEYNSDLIIRFIQNVVTVLNSK